MAAFYVSAIRGSDSTGDGTASNPWKTIGKAIGSTPAAVLDASNPNTLYLEPGIYREAVSLGVAPTAAGPLAIKGDSDGGGFAAGGHATPAAGLVEWRGWSDDASPLTAACLNAATNGAPYVSVSRIKFVVGHTQDGAIKLAGSNWTISDCNFIGSYQDNVATTIDATAATAAALNLTIERCSFLALNTAFGATINVRVDLGASSWSLNSTIRNCLFMSNASAFMFLPSGTGAAAPGGVTIQNCTFVADAYVVLVYPDNAGCSVSPPVAVYDCLFLGSAIKAGSSGQAIEDGCQYYAQRVNVNVPAGVHSRSSGCPAVDLGDGRLVGAPPRPYGSPSTVSPILGFGGYGTPPADDLAGRARPEGGGSTALAVGCYELHDTGVKNTTYQDVGSSACLALVGPSSLERLVLVDPKPTTLSVRVRWDGNHGDVTKPQAVLVAEPQIGVAGQVLTAVTTGGSGSTPNAYETLSFAPFTPTAKGAVMLRLVSRAAAGNGTAYFDTVALSS